MAVIPFDLQYLKTPWYRLHANLIVSTEAELWPIKVLTLHCENMHFRPFCLWPSPRPDDLHIRTWPVCLEDISDVWNSYLKSFESECVHLVTRGLFRLHSICRIQKPHNTCKPRGSILYRTRVMGDRSFTLREKKFSTFLLLWPWPWPDDLYIRTWSMLPGDTPDVQIWISYVKAFE